jgi:hypothetical protein
VPVKTSCRVGSRDEGAMPRSLFVILESSSESACHGAAGHVKVVSRVGIRRYTTRTTVAFYRKVEAPASSVTAWNVSRAAPVAAIGPRVNGLLESQHDRIGLIRGERVLRMPSTESELR